MTISKIDVSFIMVAMLLITGCSPSKSLQKELRETAAGARFFKGVVVADAQTGERLLELNGDKYFTPASNVKLFTLYGAHKALQDSVASFNYAVREDSLILQGTANPLFLKDSLSTKALDFLKNTALNIYLQDDDIEDVVYGPGWAWDDYTYEFMPEKSMFPVYGNVVSVYYKEGSMQVLPEFFKRNVHQMKEKRTYRDRYNNEFFVPETVVSYERKIPFITSNQLVADLLSEALNSKVILVSKSAAYHFKPFKEMSYDTLYTRMMRDSDNFIAEQIMLRVGAVTTGSYHTKEAIQYVLDHYLEEVPQKPKWVDGSGLSRYNLFTPESMVFVLKQLYDEIPKDRLLAYFAQAGRSGTLKNSFEDQPYIYAKSGSLSNNYALSGFLTTKKGAVLLFSYMNNHYLDGLDQRKKEMAAFFKQLYENY